MASCAGCVASPSTPRSRTQTRLGLAAGGGGGGGGGACSGEGECVARASAENQEVTAAKRTDVFDRRDMTRAREEEEVAGAGPRAPA